MFPIQNIDPKLKNAVATKSVIEFQYDGHPRIVEPHCYGVNEAGNNVIRVFLIGGYSSSGRAEGWRTYKQGRITLLRFTGEHFEHPRLGYKRNDSDMVQIFEQV